MQEDNRSVIRLITFTENYAYNCQLLSFPFIFRTCRNGKFKYDVDQECLARRGYTCTISDNDAFDNSCRREEEGFKCVITKESSDSDIYPHLGVCKKIEKGKFFIILSYFCLF